MNMQWAIDTPSEAGIYLFWEDGYLGRDFKEQPYFVRAVFPDEDEIEEDEEIKLYFEAHDDCWSREDWIKNNLKGKWLKLPEYTKD